MGKEFTQSLEQIDSKYSQNTHNPNDQIHIAEKSKQIDVLRLENTRLRTALSSATGLSKYFDREAEDFESVFDDAMKIHVRNLATRLELQIMYLVSHAPWNIPSVLSSRPHLNEQQARHATKMEMLALVSKFLILNIDRLRDFQEGQPKTGLILLRFPHEVASTLQGLLETRIKKPPTIEVQAILRSACLDILTTAAEFSTYLGTSDTGKHFSWRDESSEEDISNADRFDYKGDLRGPNARYDGTPQVLFGAVLYEEPDKSASVLYKGTIAYNGDLPSNYDDAELRSGQVEDILLRRTPTATQEPTNEFFDMSLIRTSRKNEIARLHKDFEERLGLSCDTLEVLVNPTSAVRDATGLSINDDAAEARSRWIYNLLSVIASWVATFLSSVRLDVLAVEARTRRIFSSLFALIEGCINSDLGLLLTENPQLKQAVHEILELSHRFSRHINRSPQLDWKFKWHQLRQEPMPWVVDEPNHWKCCLCGDVCDSPAAPGGQIVLGKICLVSPEHEHLVRRGLFMHGEVQSTPTPPPSPPPAPPAPPAPPTSENPQVPPPPPPPPTGPPPAPPASGGTKGKPRLKFKYGNAGGKGKLPGMTGEGGPDEEL